MQETGNRHPSTMNALKWFAWYHLPEDLANISKPFHELAHNLSGAVGDCPQLTIALHKLLEAKDCAVRAYLDTKDTHVGEKAAKATPPPLGEPLVPGDWTMGEGDH